MIFAILVLVCSIELAPAECGPASAIATAPLAGIVAEGLADCMRRGEIAAAARGWLGRADAYVKVRCTAITAARSVG